MKVSCFPPLKKKKKATTQPEHFAIVPIRKLDLAFQEKPAGKQPPPWGFRQSSYVLALAQGIWTLACSGTVTLLLRLCLIGGETMAVGQNPCLIFVRSVRLVTLTFFNLLKQTQKTLTF